MSLLNRTSTVYNTVRPSPHNTLIIPIATPWRAGRGFNQARRDLPMPGSFDNRYLFDLSITWQLFSGRSLRRSVAIKCKPDRGLA